MVDLVYFTVVIFIFTLFSQRILNLFKINFSSYLENLIFSFAISGIIISYFTFIIGILGVLYKSIVWGILFFLSLFIAKETRIFFITLFEKYQQIKKSEKNYLEILLWVIFIFHIIFNLLLSLSPSIYWDDIHYHLTSANIFINNHKIIYIPYFYYSNFPGFAELIFTYGMLVHSDILANLFHFTSGVMTALIIYLIGKKYFSVFVGILSAVIFYTMPTIFWLSTLAYVDLFFTFYITLIFYLLLKWCEDKNNIYLTFCGIFCGVLLGIKYSGFIFLILITFWIFFLGPKKIKNLYIFLFFSLIFASPFYIKNFIFTDNPLYPFFYNIFGGKDIDLETSLMIFKGIAGFGGKGKEMKYLSSLPFDITFKGAHYSGIIGPLYLLILPFLILIKGIDKNIKYLLLFALSYIPFWIFSSQQARFLLPALVCFAIISGWVIFKLKILGKLWYLIFILIFSSFIFNSVYLIYLGHKKFPVSLGIMSREEFLEKYFDNYSTFQFMNKYLPKNSKVFFINDNRAYHLNRSFIIGSYNYNFFKFTERYPPQSRYKKIHQIGVDYLFFNGNFPSPEIEKLIISDLKRKYLKLIYHKNNVFLFLIDYNKIYE